MLRVPVGVKHLTILLLQDRRQAGHPQASPTCQHQHLAPPLAKEPSHPQQHAAHRGADTLSTFVHAALAQLQLVLAPQAPSQCLADLF